MVTGSSSRFRTLKYDTCRYPQREGFQTSKSHPFCGVFIGERTETLALVKRWETKTDKSQMGDSLGFVESQFRLLPLVEPVDGSSVKKAAQHSGCFAKMKRLWSLPRLEWWRSQGIGHVGELWSRRRRTSVPRGARGSSGTEAFETAVFESQRVTDLEILFSRNQNTDIAEAFT